MSKGWKKEGNSKGKNTLDVTILLFRYFACNQWAKCVLTWEKLYDLLLAATKRKPSKPDKSISCCFLAVWTCVLHDPVHLDVVGFKNYNTVKMIRYHSLKWIQSNEIIMRKQMYTPSTYRWPIVSLSFLTAIFRSSSVSNSTKASPLGRPSRV